MEQLRPGRRLEMLGDHVAPRAHAGAAVFVLTRCVRGRLDESPERVDLERRRREQRQVDGADIGDVVEILDRVVGRVGEADRRHVEGREVRQHEGVPVGRGLLQRGRRDGAGRARLVLDDELLAEALAQLVGQEAGDEIARASRRKRHDDADGLLWPRALRAGVARGGEAGGEGEKRGGEEGSAIGHGVLGALGDAASVADERGTRS
jgi:hypothetical protein